MKGGLQLTVEGYVDHGVKKNKLWHYSATNINTNYHVRGWYIDYIFRLVPCCVPQDTIYWNRNTLKLVFFEVFAIYIGIGWQ